MSDKKVTVTLDELKLSIAEVNELGNIVAEMPYKYAKPIYDYINKKIEDQLSVKAKAIQAELTPVE